MRTPVSDWQRVQPTTVQTTAQESGPYAREVHITCGCAARYEREFAAELPVPPAVG
jgi:hypothetical protein